MQLVCQPRLSSRALGGPPNRTGIRVLKMLPQNQSPCTRLPTVLSSAASRHSVPNRCVSARVCHSGPLFSREETASQSLRSFSRLSPTPTPRDSGPFSFPLWRPWYWPGPVPGVGGRKGSEPLLPLSELPVGDAHAPAIPVLRVCGLRGGRPRSSWSKEADLHLLQNGLRSVCWAVA